MADTNEPTDSNTTNDSSNIPTMPELTPNRIELESLDLTNITERDAT